MQDMLEEGLEILLRRERRLPTGNEKMSHAGFPEKNQWERRGATRTEGKVSVNHGNRNDDSACSSANREGTTGKRVCSSRENGHGGQK